MVEIFVPALGESVSEASIAKWHKQEGDQVNKDDLIVELETDKVTLEVNSPASGVIGKLLFNSGDAVKIGDLLTSIAEGAVSINISKVNQEAVVEQKHIVKNESSISEKAILSPAAQKLASENNVNISNIDNASGKNGRITKGDILSAVNQNNIQESEMSLAVINNRVEDKVKITRLRKKIAERLKYSQNTAAILTTFNEVDMMNIINLRNRYKDIFEKKHGVKLGFMSFFVKAAIAALKEIPAVNAEIDGDDIIYKKYFDIGVAVGTEQGLVVPIIRNAEELNFAEIEKSIGAYGKKAREGKLTMQDLSGGTFTISNGGVYGSLLSTPIINPPQSGILGMHKTQERAVVINGKIEIRPMMYLALSYDHRIIDGKEAVTFLVKVKENIENPERLLFDL